MLTDVRIAQRANTPLGVGILLHQRKHNLTLKELGAQTGVTVPTLSTWVTGRRTPSLRELRRFCDAAADTEEDYYELCTWAGIIPESLEREHAKVGLWSARQRQADHAKFAMKKLKERDEDPG